jgi:hypothetical protein
MKIARIFAAVLAALSLIAWCGCGDDDDRGDQAETSQPPPVVSPENAFAQDKSYNATLNDGQQVEIHFPASGRYELSRDGTNQTGTASNAARNSNLWTLNLTPDEGQLNARSGVLRLEFTAAETGLWTFAPEEGPSETGTFVMSAAPPGEPPDPPEPGFNRTLQLFYAVATEKFQFFSANEVSYENGFQVGTYTYDSTDHRLLIVLPNGWHYDITLADGGTATVVFRQNESAEPEIQQATYTLQ